MYLHQYGQNLIIENTKNYKVLTALVELGSAIVALLLTPLFKFTWPKDIKVYLIILLSGIFYAISDRLNTIVRSKIETSTFMILRQLATIFIIIIGFLFLKEKFIINKFIGALIVILGNIIVFIDKGKLKLNKYILLSVIANLCLAIAILIDVKTSELFNLSFYVFLTLFIPGILIIIFEKIKIKEIKNEFKNNNNKLLIELSILNTASIILQLLAYRNGEIVLVAPLCSLTIITDVVYGLIKNKEKNNILNKITAAILIVIGIMLINR